MAWRAWNLITDWRDSYLWSLVHSARWDGPVLRADAKPTRANTNGIYALRSLDGVPFGNVWGEVALSGVVVEGEVGYRAEVATIRSLYLGREQRALEADGYHAGYTFTDWPDAALLAALEARYKVDVVVAAPSAVPAMPPQPAMPPYQYHQQGVPIAFPLGVQLIGSSIVHTSIVHNNTSIPFGGVFGTGASNI